jgi:hypothetical protein
MSHNRNHKPGQRVISTWLYLEGVTESGTYPQVPGKSSSQRFHNTYKKCLVTFFHSARAANPSALLYLFCNVDFRMSEEKIDQRLTAMFSKLEVEIIIVSYTYKPPKKQVLWRNQFYVLNILEELLKRVDECDTCIILDSDVIWTGLKSTNDMWNKLKNEGSLTMLPITSDSEVINGYSLNELNSLANLLCGSTHSQIYYAGGELIGLRGDILQLVVTKSKQTWGNYLELLGKSETKYIEEAHFLSIIYSCIGIKFGTGDEYIRRIWTQVFHYNNRLDIDSRLACWHLPAEKRFAIRRIANRFLKNSSLTWPSQDSKEWLNIQGSLGVIKKTQSKAIMDVTFSLFDRIIRRII